AAGCRLAAAANRGGHPRIGRPGGRGGEPGLAGRVGRLGLAGRGGRPGWPTRVGRSGWRTGAVGTSPADPASGCWADPRGSLGQSRADASVLVRVWRMLTVRTHSDTYSHSSWCKQGGDWVTAGVAVRKSLFHGL